MKEIINWLNVNQGFVLGILTLVYVVTTLVMAGLMMHSNRLTRQLEEQRSRPAVIFNVISIDYWVHAIMKNTGLTPAYDVKVSCTPSITSDVGGKDTETALTAHCVSFLAPQQEITDFIDGGPQFFKRYPDPVFTGTVKYKDRSGTPYKEDFRIDLSVLKSRSYLSRVDVGKELEKIRRTLEHLASGFSRPFVRTITEAEYRQEQRELIEACRKRAEEAEKKNSEENEDGEEDDKRGEESNTGMDHDA